MALASSEMRKTSSATSAARFIWVTCVKMASVSGIFLRLTLGYLLRVVAEGVEFRREGLHGGQGVICVALLGDELASDFGGAQPSIQPGRPKPRVSLTLAINKGFDIGEQVGQVVFHALSPTGRAGIKTLETAFQLMGAFADSHPAPAEVAFCTPLSAWP